MKSPLHARSNSMATLLQDVRFSVRVLRKSRGFTIAAVVTLALGIGANAVVFSVMNGLIIRPLGVPQEDSLYSIQRGSYKSLSESYPDYLDLRDRNRSFDGIAGYTFAQVALDTGDSPTRAWAYEVSGNYFDLLGVQPYVGRLLQGEDERGANSAPYIVLTYGYWHAHFKEDRDVIGRTVQLNKHPFVIIGVTQPGFHGTLVVGYPDFFVPMINQEQVEAANNLNERGISWIFTVIGRLKPGVTREQAIADLNSIGSYLEKTYPKDEGPTTFTLGRPSLFGDEISSDVRSFVTGVMLLAALILLAACANLGSLFAARAADRSREVALRLALGAGRSRILRQLFTEAMLISLVGGALGLWGSTLLLSALSAWRPLPRFPLQVLVNPDATVYGIALLLALVSGLLFGAVPVGQILRTDPFQVIKSGSTSAAWRRLTVRDLLLAVQIAICAVLVTSSMVAVRGLARSLHSDFGFDPENALLIDTDLTMAGYNAGAVPEMQKRMIEALETIPGVEAVGLADTVPLGDGMNTSNVFTDETADLRPANAAANVQVCAVSPDYFRADGTALLTGRTFTWQDDKTAPRVAIINPEFARRIFGSVANAMGSYYRMPDGAWLQVVGIVQDGKYSSLAEDPQPAMFLPILQSPSSQTYLVVRSRRDPQELAAGLRSRLRDLDEGLSIYIQTRYKELDGPLFAPRMATLSLGVLGVMGALLSITGIFGMAAHSVSKRLRELGVLIALGARGKEVLRAALGRAIKLMAIGSAAGLVVGILAARVLALIVYEATPRDPLVLAGVVTAMSLMGLLATWVPARRALSIDPAILLRNE